MRVLIGIAALSCMAVVAAASHPGAQGPPPPRNLQVLPKTWTQPQVQTLMATFAESLGLHGADTCAHCHARNPHGPSFDYALDEKREKEVARKMIQMVIAVNGDFLKDIGDAAVHEKVTCFTCHKGGPKPAAAPETGWTRGAFSLLPAGPPVPAPNVGHHLQ